MTTTLEKPPSRGNEDVVAARLPRRLTEELDRLAEREERSRSFLIRKAVEQYLRLRP